jgi:hypothetical protein
MWPASRCLHTICTACLKPLILRTDHCTESDEVWQERIHGGEYQPVCWPCLEKQAVLEAELIINA